MLFCLRLVSRQNFWWSPNLPCFGASWNKPPNIFKIKNFLERSKIAEVALAASFMNLLWNPIPPKANCRSISNSTIKREREREKMQARTTNVENEDEDEDETILLLPNKRNPKDMSKSQEWAVRHRWGLMCFALFQSFCVSGVIYGWPSLVLLLREEGLYACDGNEESFSSSSSSSSSVNYLLPSFCWLRP